MEIVPSAGSGSLFKGVQILCSALKMSAQSSCVLEFSVATNVLLYLLVKLPFSMPALYGLLDLSTLENLFTPYDINLLHRAGMDK